MNDEGDLTIRRIAQVARGIVLGLLLFAAVVSLILASTGSAIFRYQGF